SSSFFFYATAPTDIYTLSLHDALPILFDRKLSGSIDYYNKLNTNVIMNVQPVLNSAYSTNFFDHGGKVRNNGIEVVLNWRNAVSDRKSTRLNSSHVKISYAVFCLKKKK